ncbi:MAG: winged helix-turn-helix transcriptional regulator [Anaerolineae bacterium]|nr:winged helix-turn-helix transcriptional regulator [Anaerolineae bacterium]
MNDTRWTVLEAIKAQGQATVASLAEALGVTAISIRHHLNSLQGEGLVKVEIERQGVGRPRHLYSLTEAAQRYFPNKYHILVERLLDELKATLPANQIDAIIDKMAANVAAQYAGSPQQGTMEERLQHLVSVLGAEGFMAAVKHVDNHTVLTELNCPYMYVGQRHPEVCRIDHTLIRSVLGVEVEQKSCVLNGDRSCTFSVQETSTVS